MSKEVRTKRGALDGHIPPGLPGDIQEQRQRPAQNQQHGNQYSIVSMGFQPLHKIPPKPQQREGRKAAFPRWRFFSFVSR